jgi:serine/threonine protein kinase
MTTAQPQHRLALPPGYELGRYRLQQILGSGGFGITYLAEDKTLGRRVAIKELLPNDIATRLDGTTVVAKTESEEQSLAWARERFVGEGRALAACDHPNVVNVYEMVEANGTAYMVTKYEDGKSFEQWLRDLGRPPNEAELRSILMPLLAGLETVHKAGFLHRDIKPENIYVTQNGRPVLLDFGSARQAITNRSTALTSIVTSGYAPFEQYHEDGNQGAWSDIYALAAVMYRAITGKKPPEATRRLKDDPCPKLVSEYAGRYDAQFLRAIDKGLEVNEAKRPKSIAEWRTMFGSDDRLPLDSDETRLIARPPAAKTVSPFKSIGLNPVVIGAVVGAVLVVGLILWAVTWPGHKPQPPNPSPTPAASTTPVPSAAPTASPVTPQTPAPGISPAPGSSASPAPSQANQAVDPQLVGSWDEINHKAHWEQNADGHYALSGGLTGSGATIASNGKITQYPNNSSTPHEATYQFQGDILVVNGPNGETRWRRVNPDNSSHHSTSHGQSTQHREKPADAGRHLLKRVFPRFR